MDLTRGEWVTLIVWLLALTLNVLLLDEDVQRQLGLCGESWLHTCEEEEARLGGAAGWAALVERA